MVTIDDVVAEIRRLAAENPNHIYEQPSPGECLYQKYDDEGNPTGQGDCIVGQAILNTGLAQPAELEGHEGWTANIVLSNLLGISGEPGIRFAKEVQDYQDTGTPWGEAVEKADTHG